MNNSIIDPFILYNIARFANVHILKNLVRASRPFHTLVANNCGVKYDLMDCYASAGLLLYSDGRTMIKHGIQNYERMKIYWRNNKIHRDGDLPAIINKDGTMIWLINGVRHRDGDQPALITSDGDQKWFNRGVLHRNNDLPAIIYANGDQKWYQNDELHRDGDLPAVILANGNQKWYKNGIKMVYVIVMEILDLLLHDM